MSQIFYLLQLYAFILSNIHNLCPQNRLGIAKNYALDSLERFTDQSIIKVLQYCKKTAADYLVQRGLELKTERTSYERIL